MKIPFVKLHGVGNDFIVSRAALWELSTGRLAAVEADGGASNFLCRLARAICERHTGVGADGFLVILAPRSRSNDARVRFFNADGSEAEMSGNGIRCVGAFLEKSGMRKRRLKVETPAGVRTLDRVIDKKAKWSFRVSMGRPILAPAEIPFVARNARTPVVGYPLAVRRKQFRATVTSMGNPHCSLFVEDFERTDWPAIGRAIEIHPRFPKRTNVEFVRVISRREIDVRYWERGVGITASSGTGSCAAVVASILNGFTGRTVRVRTVAGALLVEWPENGEVTLTGPAHWIADGTYFA